MRKPPLNDDVCKRLRAALAEYDRAFSPLKLTRAQYDVLVYIRHTKFEPVIQRRLVIKTGMDRSTLSDVVRRLERQGYLERGAQIPGHGIQKPLFLTDAGEKICKSAMRIVKKADKKLRAALADIVGVAHAQE